jgi:[ribosomal protein S5]-alanine N-acetyltransferase
VQLTTARLTLEPLTVAHATHLHAGFADSSLYTWIPDDPHTLDTLTARFERIAAGPRDRADELWRNWAIRATDASTPTYVGMVETSVFPGDYAYLAYFIFSPWQRRGYAHDACTAAIAHVREAYAVARILIEIDVRNVASWKLAESLGAKRVATKMNADFFKGQSSDEYHYEIVF